MHSVGIVHPQSRHFEQPLPLRSGATLYANDFYADPANTYEICDVRDKFCF